MGLARDELGDDDEMLAPTVDGDRGPGRESSTLRAGSILGGAYHVVRRLGQGGMGTVYVVEHTELKKRFAAKVVSKKLSESAIKRLRNEARVTSAIDHDNIVSVVNLGRQPDGAVFVIMELLEGEDLGQRLERAAAGEGDAWLPHEELTAYVPQILDGLAAAHAAGVIHRDLKPDNVFLAKKDDGRVTAKLLDFGIAKNIEPDDDHRLTRTGQIIGTPLYMAPEQARNMSDADLRADIYSVGVILYEMVTGAPPFEADTLFDLIVQHATQPPVPPCDRRPDLPKPVESVILRCLEKDRALRFESVPALRAAWDAAWKGIAPEPTSAEVALTVETPAARTIEDTGRTSLPGAVPAAEPAPRPSGPPRVAIAAFVGTFVLGLGGASAWILAGRDDPPRVEPTPAIGHAEREAPAPEPEAAAPPPREEPTAPATIARILQTEPQGATVTRDGEVLGTTPLNLVVPESGAMTVMVALDGYATQWVDVRGDTTERMDVTLERDGARRGRGRGRRVEPTPGGAPPSETGPAPPPPAEEPRGRSSGQFLLGMDQFEAEQRR